MGFFQSSLQKTGGQIRRQILLAGFQVNLLLKTLGQFPHLPKKLRETIQQMYLGGAKAFPVVALVSLFAGMILSFQTGIQLAKFGQEESVGALTAVTMCWEMGPFITGIILAAAVGAAQAAEIGTMAVSEEILALEVMSINPVRFLVLPRVAALALMCPILTIFSDLIGTAGGAIVSRSQLNVDFALYWTQAMDAIRPTGGFAGLPKGIYTGLIKAFVYGIMISVVSCGAGLRARNGARGVGEATRGAVRNSIVLILVLGYFMTWFFNQ